MLNSTYLALIVLLLAPLAFSASTSVPAGHLGAVNAALSTAQHGDVIILGSGTFYGCDTDKILLNKNVTIRGMHL